MHSGLANEGARVCHDSPPQKQSRIAKRAEHFADWSNLAPRREGARIRQGDRHEPPVG